MTSNKFVSIAESSPNKLRIYVSDAVLIDIKSQYIEFDILNLRMRPAREEDQRRGNSIRRLSGRQQIVFSNIPNQAKLVGRYDATQQGEWWVLQKIVPTPKKEEAPVSSRPKYPYRITFP